MLPSPSTSMTSRSGLAICAPMAAGRPKPMVPMLPDVSHVRGCLKSKYCAAHIWCWPTPVETMASPLVISFSISSTYCGWMSFALAVVVAARGRSSARRRAPASGAKSFLKPVAVLEQLARGRAWRRTTCDQSTFLTLPISAASMSMWAIFALGRELLAPCRRRGRRSARRRRSGSRSPRPRSWRMPCRACRACAATARRSCPRRRCPSAS